jgi:hypothetical protein
MSEHVTIKAPTKKKHNTRNPKHASTFSKSGCVSCSKLARALAHATKSDPMRPAKQRFFDEKSLATRWGSSVKLLQKMRSDGSGPAYYKIGRSVRYRLRDIVAYEKLSLFNSTAQSCARPEKR